MQRERIEDTRKLKFAFVSRKGPPTNSPLIACPGPPEIVIMALRDELEEKLFEIENLRREVEGLVYIRDQGKLRMELYEQTLSNTEASQHSVTAQLRLSITELGKKSLRINELETENAEMKKKVNKGSTRGRATTAEMSIEEENTKLRTQIAMLEDRNRQQILEIAQIRDFDLASARSKISSLEKQLEEKSVDLEQIKIVELPALRNRIHSLEAQQGDSQTTPKVRRFQPFRFLIE